MERRVAREFRHKVRERSLRIPVVASPGERWLWALLLRQGRGEAKQSAGL